MAKTRQKVAWSVLLTFIIFVIAAGVLVTGQPVYTGEDYKSLELYDAVGNATTVSGLKASNNVVYFTPGGDAAKIILTIDAQVREVKSSVNSIAVDLSYIEEINGTNAKIAKVYISDGTYDIALGTIDLTASKKAEFMLDPEDLNNMNDFAYAKIIILFYDENGTLTNYVKGGAESGVGLVASTKLNTSSVNAFIASGIMALVVAVRRAAHAVVGVFTSAATALITNSALLTLALPIAIFFLAFTKQGKNVRRKIGLYI